MFRFLRALRFLWEKREHYVQYPVHARPGDTIEINGETYRVLEAKSFKSDCDIIRSVLDGTVEKS